MICTANYSSKFNSNTRVVSISLDGGNEAGFRGEVCSKLMPTKNSFDMWKNNPTKRTTKNNNTFFAEDFYKQVLSKLDPQEVYDSLDGAILLCEGDAKDFSPRQVVAAWFELLLDMEIPEVKSNGGKIEFCERDKTAKEILFNILKEKYKGSGCNSVRAAYLNEKARQIIVASFDVRDEAKKSELKEAAVELKTEAIYAEMAYNHDPETKFKFF